MAAPGSHALVPASQEEREMVPMSLNGDGPSVREPKDMTVVSGQEQGEVVDARVFIHAP